MMLMRVRTPVLWISAVCASTTFLLWASDSWLNKDYKDWTEKDASALLTESPWAKVIPLPSTDRPSQVVYEGPPDAGPRSASWTGPNTANPAVTGSNQGTEGESPARPSVLTPAGLAQPTGAPAIQPTVTIIWASALPVRLAELKLRTHGTPPTGAQMQAATKPRENYVIVVVGLPEPENLAQVNALAPAASLDSSSKVLPCSRSEFRKINGRNIYIFRFPKSSTFTVDDREVQFRVTLGRMQIKKKFELRDMQYQGKLAL